MQITYFEGSTYKRKLQPRNIVDYTKTSKKKTRHYSRDYYRKWSRPNRPFFPVFMWLGPFEIWPAKILDFECFRFSNGRDFRSPLYIMGWLYFTCKLPWVYNLNDCSLWSSYPNIIVIFIFVIMIFSQTNFVSLICHCPGKIWLTFICLNYVSQCFCPYCPYVKQI